jgi:hypothetical protein
MSTESHTSRESAGGDGLLFGIAMAVVAVVAVEGLLIAFSSWWFMGLALVLVIGAAVGVSAALVRLMDADEPEPEPEPAAEPTIVTGLVRREAWSAMTRHARVHPS